jgi:hypothetical protein
MLEIDDRPRVYYYSDKYDYYTIGRLQDSGTYTGELLELVNSTVTWEAPDKASIGDCVDKVIEQYLKECEEQGINPEMPERTER